MPVLEPDTAPAYLEIIGPQLGKRYGVRLRDLVRPARRAYRARSAAYFDEWFRSTTNERLQEPEMSRKWLASWMNETANRIGRWLHGSRGYPMDFVFATELWSWETSPLRPPVLESARAAGVCAAVQSAHRFATETTPPDLAPRDFWQLHHLFANAGWLETEECENFEAACAARSRRAEQEFNETVEGRHPSGGPYLHYELVRLCDEWGLLFLATRLALSA